MDQLKKNSLSFIISLIFIAYTLFFFNIYKEFSLGGNINNHILASERFGTPIELKTHGIKPLYYGQEQTGWDGQFYYYMSNDVFALKDTPQHIDAPSYRYQRIGLSLYTAIVAKILGADWVSPTLYFYSYLLLILCATFFGANLFSKLNLSPFLILLWSLNVGTQITLFNALPDAAADAFLILALTALYAKRYVLSVIPFVFSALSREIYVLFPTFILLFLFIDSFLSVNNKSIKNIIINFFRWRSYYLLIIPGLVAIGWHIYIIKHFGIAPGDQAYGILGLPLVAWATYFTSSILGHHKETGSLLLFLLILIASLWVSINALMKRHSISAPEIRGLCCAFIMVALLYLCFGPTVMMNYTGYIKALALFFFLIPLLLAATHLSEKMKMYIYRLLIIALIFTSLYNMKERIFSYEFFNNNLYSNATQMLTVTETRHVECFDQYAAKIKINHIKIIKPNFIPHLLGRENLLIITLQLTNTGQYDWFSTRKSGGVFMSYQWINTHGKIVKDGIKSALPGIVHPGQTVVVQVISQLPRSRDEIHLRLSPIQEGCQWFYIANPEISTDVNLSIVH